MNTKPECLKVGMSLYHYHQRDVQVQEKRESLDLGAVKKRNIEILVIRVAARRRAVVGASLKLRLAQTRVEAEVEVQ